MGAGFRGGVERGIDKEGVRGGAAKVESQLYDKLSPANAAGPFRPDRVDIAFYMRHIDRVAPFEWVGPAGARV